jgi:hypothetical protein
MLDAGTPPSLFLTLRPLWLIPCLFQRVFLQHFIPPSVWSPFIEVRRHLPTMFIFWTGRNDERKVLALGSAVQVAKLGNWSGFRASLNLFMLDSSNESDVRMEISCLGRLQPGLPARSIHISIEELIRRSGVNFTDLTHLYPIVHRSIPRAGPMIARLFIPFVYPADFYFYLDSDAWPQVPFVHLLRSLLVEQDHVIWGCPDAWFAHASQPQQYLKQVKPSLHFSQYFGSGVLLFRGGPLLLEQLGKAIAWMRDESPERARYSDQCALNFGCDRERIGLMPKDWVPFGMGTNPRAPFVHCPGPGGKVKPRQFMTKLWKRTYETCQNEIERGE